MFNRTLVVLVISAGSGLAADWNAQSAAAYLDSRQKDWFAWPAANAHGTPCLSCHTGLPYLLARPGLRRALSEPGPTQYETGLLNSLRVRLASKSAADGTPPPDASVEAVLSALLLVRADAPSAHLSPETQQALDRFWRMQLKSGPTAGAWNWYSLDLDPWETVDSAFFGASMAAMAIGSTPPSYQAQPHVREGIAALLAYLRKAQSGQPLHNRIALLWASSKLPAAVTNDDRRALLAEIKSKQQSDGGWSIESLGAFAEHPAAPAAVSGSNSYATAFTAFVMSQAGVGPRDHALKRALAWLREHQDPSTGAWAATSMNKSYKPGSNQIRFMQDAATAYAALALLAHSH